LNLRIGERSAQGGDVATKDRGGSKTSKKPAQHNLKQKRQAKEAKKEGR